MIEFIETLNNLTPSGVVALIAVLAFLGTCVYVVVDRVLR